GCVSEDRKTRFEAYFDSLAKCLDDLNRLSLSPSEAQKHDLALNRDGIRRTAFQLLSYPDISLERILAIWPELSVHGQKILNAAAVDAVYAVYLDRQKQDIAERRREENRLIPDGFRYDNLPGLSHELKTKLERIRPPSVGHAERIEGMTPAAIALLLAHLRRSSNGDEVVLAG
ncbi:MAG: tRNA uridine-5-carboxymethylaminomethyl(34) synthesis enzyme MnmG, partial [Alphaproteobacteria bacterium]|nr:tRNA uridine-5-carboxymethylaminomethyl(34) synthesis enzyme MnmG [Alphaproteobacteria bacterium]